MAQQVAGFLGLAPQYGYLIIGLVIGLVIGRFSRANSGGTREIGGGARDPGGVVSEMSFRSTTPLSFEMTVNGEKIEINPETVAEIRRLIGNGDKIAAIKLVREATRMDLVEAKRLVETMEHIAR